MQKLDPPESLSNPDLELRLIQLTKDEEPAIRSRATFALGQFGSPAAIERLEVLVDDPDKDTRFDAAVALAHRGNAKGVETLAEMLDVAELSKMVDGADEKDPSFKRDVIVATALDATHALARQNPQADLSLVTQAIERLIATDSQELNAAHISPRAKSDAELVLPDLKSKQ
jgi:HEAT repeat protein